MNSATHSDPLLEAHAEIRDLRAAIAEMRAALELLNTDKQRAVQQATADAALENAQLRETITAMRQQMEQMQYDKQRAVQQAVAGAAAEIQQHAAAIRAAREMLEQLKERHAVEAQELRRELRAQEIHARDSIAALGAQLEAAHGLA